MVNLSPQNRISNWRLVLGSLHSFVHNFWTADPNAMKPPPLKTKHPKLSNELIIIEFGSVTKEIYLFEVRQVADVKALSAKRVNNVNAPHFGSYRFGPLPKPCLPSSCKAKTCGNCRFMHCPCCYTHFTPTTSRDTPLQLWFIRMQHPLYSLTLFTSFHLFSYVFSLYKASTI